ncbi:M20 family metallopeptidase [Shouchella clausii]|nr:MULTISPECIES: M20 family metallopeptidase [Shouchella]ALA53391.1 Catalyzes the cleavage of p-aminobenzoyl-glutamate to p-aminobenzoate and glutamate, subunit A [Shouchella clausii]MBU3233266.1 M20 family metallopeptidase [Shouchella clausii]MBU3263906.1 M20 family metallopeptidase [Shouchella clausii]MBU3509232.1 M20 family metallopeptidase [Shouchella clausii]MBU3535556.1 M20 family metallopeptidase [Shouchella clausii]
MLKNKSITEKKRNIEEAVDRRDSELRQLALNIHAHPELGYQEYKASNWLSTLLEKEGFAVKRGIAGLDTAFTATWAGKAGGPVIGLLAEYDALPRLGHACGHNLIGTSSVGAALALKDAFPELQATIQVIGTPAEEGLGGKVIMCEHGVFNHLDAAMMCHPKNKTMVIRGGLARVGATFKFYGKESHAASAPEKGVSALDALVGAYNAINSLRQFFSDDVRIHGVITHGGDAANIVPGYSEASFLIRCNTRKELEHVKEKVYTAVRQSAAAVGATSKIEEHLIYAERNTNKTLANLFKENLQLMGIEVSPPPLQGGIGSSDIGNVSQLVPTIHPYIKIGEATNHTHDFTNETKSEGGLKGMNQAAKALAMTAYDLCELPGALQRVKEEFANWQLENV